MNIKLDNVEFELKEYHDFSWLHKLGTVFSVYYNQDSGNLLFGVEKDGVKKFVKYAGAKTTIEYEGTPEDAITRLEKAVIIYENIKHPNLIKFEQAIKCPEGIATVFEWFDGRGMHEAWTFNKCGKLEPASPYYQYLHLPVEKRLQSMSAIFEFLTYVESIGYVAVDFYDGSIMYDFNRDVTKICDIDFFKKKPAIIDIGENFWGSKRFKSPEEYILGAKIDGDTNAFTLGAIIFHFFGNYSDSEVGQMYQNNAFFACSLENWTLSKQLYDVVLKAVEKDRSKRYSSMTEFFNSWNKALPTV